MMLSQKYQRIEKKIESIKKKQRAQAPLITEEDCEVEVADERESESMNIQHNVMKVRESGLFPSKTRNPI